MGIFSYEIHTIFWSIVVNFTFEWHDWITMADNKQKNGQKLALSVLFLDLKFCKNLGFSLCEHCEWGTLNLKNFLKCSSAQLKHTFEEKYV